MLDVIDEEFVTFYEFINIKATEQQGMLFCGGQTTSYRPESSCDLFSAQLYLWMGTSLIAPRYFLRKRLAFCLGGSTAGGSRALFGAAAPFFLLFWAICGRWF